MRPRQIGQQLSTAMLTSVSTQDVQNYAWPHGTSETAERGATKHTWQQSDMGGASTDGGEDVVADTLVAADTGAGTVAVGGSASLALSLLVLLCGCSASACAPRL